MVLTIYVKLMFFYHAYVDLLQTCQFAPFTATATRMS